MATLSQNELERHLWQAADILRGTVDAGDYKQYIFGLLFYRRLCDVWDEEFEALLAETGDREEAADPEEHRFHIPPQHHWNAVRKHSTQIGQHLNNAFACQSARDKDPLSASNRDPLGIGLSWSGTAELVRVAALCRTSGYGWARCGF